MTPFTTVTSMPQKFGQMAQPDLKCLTSSAAGAAAARAAGRAAAMNGNCDSSPASAPTAAVDVRKLRRWRDMRRGPLLGAGAAGRVSRIGLYANVIRALTWINAVIPDGIGSRTIRIIVNKE